MELITDMNVLYDAFRASMVSSAWKEEPQRFEMDFLSELTAIKEELENRTYKTSKGTEFTLHERGKIRHIHGNRMRDRVVRHALCDNVLAPALKPYIIHNNGASQKDKGVDFARRLFERDLHNYWLEHGTNEGWVWFMDFSKFYDNLRHDRIREAVLPKIPAYFPTASWLFSEIIDTFRVDVSYMTDEEFADCLDMKFDSIEYFNTIPDELRTGKKFMEKSADIGDQTSQDVGVFMPTPIDNYATIVRGSRRYGRYMDDSYMVHEDKDFIMDVQRGICEIAADMGIFINEKKTRICKLSKPFTYLQIRYFLTDKGKVVRRISPKSVTRERRRLKAYARLLSAGRMEYLSIEQAYKSWMGSYYKLMSKKQVSNMKQLYKNLFGKEPRWKE